MTIGINFRIELMRKNDIINFISIEWTKRRDIMLDFSEKVYKRVSEAGVAGLVIGISILVLGIAIGTISIVFSARALAAKRHLID